MLVNRLAEKWRRLYFMIQRNASTLTFIAAASFTIFLAAGGLYDLVENPLSLLPQSGGGWTFIYTGSINLQTVSESVVAGISYVLGIAGFYLIYRSTRLLYKPRQAYILVLMGLIMTIIALAYATVLLQTKLTSPS
ncbi:MAG: hypothetical protein QXR65_01510 [Candidatus Bathyarchaeia archaeon]|nr:hypothetical protein [Candidatus Bathyarchaeota archaeon]